MNFECREFAFDSPVYKVAVLLREDVLRKPLGLEWDDGIAAGEDQSFHLGCFINDRLLATLVLQPIDQTTVKMRQVAVAFDVQGNGVGTTLVRHAEEFAKSAGFIKIVAHARELAIPFYRRLGYHIEGDSFYEVSLRHYFISKELGRE